MSAVGVGTLALLYPEPKARASVPATEGNLCATGEQVIYSCSFPRGIGSVCRGGSSLHYRFGRTSHVDIDIANEPNWRNVHTGGVVGNGGGAEQHIRFTSGAVHYIVFAGEMGRLTDHPGRHYSGIAVLGGDEGQKSLATLDCKGHAQIARDGLTGALYDLRAGPAEEAQNGPFDAWF